MPSIRPATRRRRGDAGGRMARKGDHDFGKRSGNYPSQSTHPHRRSSGKIVVIPGRAANRHTPNRPCGSRSACRKRKPIWLGKRLAGMDVSLGCFLLHLDRISITTLPSTTATTTPHIVDRKWNGSRRADVSPLFLHTPLQEIPTHRQRAAAALIIP